MLGMVEKTECGVGVRSQKLMFKKRYYLTPCFLPLCGHKVEKTESRSKIVRNHENHFSKE